ncbi:hypothetical protein VP501E541_P0159 [Vibrio phage 501E54-1]|nr:hypothetical protein VP501E541_P0159 [Vibrio phage 501E54-1]
MFTNLSPFISLPTHIAFEYMKMLFSYIRCSCVRIE